MKKVFIAVTAYDSRVYTDCAISIVNNMEVLRKNKIEFYLHFETKCCYLPIARNNCVSKFLNSDCTDLVFVDSDLAFKPDAIIKLLSYDKDIVCGLYPFKQDKEDYPVRLITNTDGTYKIDPYTGLIEIEGGPTGLMKIKRSVIEEMIKKYPQTECITDQGESIYTLFDTGILREPKKWYGEDYLFCLRWRDIGGQIWAEVDITFSHIGHKMYSGNYKEYMDKLPKKEN